MVAYGSGRRPCSMSTKGSKSPPCIPGKPVCFTPRLAVLTLSGRRYSSDFFDSKHQVVVSSQPRIRSGYPTDEPCVCQLGGSFATVPRLAQRRTVRNWYQHNYPYAWVGGRVAYDEA